MKPLSAAGAREPSAATHLPTPRPLPTVHHSISAAETPRPGNPALSAASLTELGRGQGRGQPQELQHAPDLPCSCPCFQDVDKQYVGFATLPNQVHRKSVKKGFDFTLMVAGEWAWLPGGAGQWPARLFMAPWTDSTPSLYLWAGESGLGKSTLVHSLFLTDLYKDRKLLSAEGEWAPHCLCTASPSPAV